MRELFDSAVDAEWPVTKPLTSDVLVGLAMSPGDHTEGVSP
jgi:hypothetical protein